MEGRHDDRLAPFPPLEDGKIDTDQFLEAARGVVDIVDKFGKVFAPVKSDMNGNITKINKQFQTDVAKHKTLHDMITLEIVEGGNNDVILSLLWLTRGLHFMEIFLEKLLESSKEQEPLESLKNELTYAYSVSLKPFHGWLNQKLFMLICRMCPSREDFIKSLTNNEKDDDFYKNVEAFLQTLHENRCEINRFYTENNLNNNDVV